MLILICGLPGVGKTTIAQALAPRCGAVYLRIDAIEHAIRSADVLRDAIGPAGYCVGYALAETNLKLGHRVIVECVNPIALTRDAWRAVAKAADRAILEVELTCSDAAEHRRRVETRVIDIPGHQGPTWRDVQERLYEPWEPSLRIDTARLSASAAVEKILAAIGA